LASLALSKIAAGTGTTQHQSRLWYGSEINVENIQEHKITCEAPLGTGEENAEGGEKKKKAAKQP